MFLIIYVDDIYLFINDKKSVLRFRDQLFKVFDIIDNDNKAYFLSINIEWINDGVKISQRTTIEQMLKKYKLEDIPITVTPITDVLEPNTNGKARSEFIKRYLLEVRSYIYPAQMSRLDIAFATGVTGRFLLNLSQQYSDAVRRIYTYLKGTKTLGMIYKKKTPITLEGYIDSDYAGYPNTFRSITG